MYSVIFIAWLSFLLFTSANTIVITVGGNTTSNPGGVFSPQTVQANIGDTILFNFTQGNHSATQSTFAQPCVPAHKSNSSINGFDSWYRDAGNYNAITQLKFDVTDKNPVWFYDYTLCGKGGVGAINDNESSNQTFAGFVRNALRLYGTPTSSASSSGHSNKPIETEISETPSATPSTMISSADRAIVEGFFVIFPALIMLTALSL